MASNGEHIATSPGSVADADGAERYYDSRYRQGYMDDGDWAADRRERIARLVGELPLPHSGRVLDFGCGSGVFTQVLKSALPDWEVVGTDLSTEALRLARARSSECKFEPLPACEALPARFDLVFTHHVLEHVGDLSATARTLLRLLAPSGAMLHVLPCGNAGSLAHRSCTLTRGGIDDGAEGRFFFEEPGHLRRLTTERMAALWAADGFELRRAHYAEHLFGAISSVTQFDMAFVRNFANPGMAINRSAAMKLHVLRVCLCAVWLLRKPAAVVANKRSFGVRTIRDVALLGPAILAYPASRAFDALVRGLAAWESRRRRDDRRAGEMYLFFVRMSN
jgi:SAM-dependent methyltransferase